MHANLRASLSSEQSIDCITTIVNRSGKERLPIENHRFIEEAAAIRRSSYTVRNSRTVSGKNGRRSRNLRQRATDIFVDLDVSFSLKNHVIFCCCDAPAIRAHFGPFSRIV